MLASHLHSWLKPAVKYPRQTIKTRTFFLTLTYVSELYLPLRHSMRLNASRFVPNIKRPVLYFEGESDISAGFEFDARV
jgi:hypothetical protein